MAYYTGADMEIINVPPCDDCIDLQKALAALKAGNREFHIRYGAAPLRFFLAAVAAKISDGNYYISVGKQLLRRPLKPLLEALSQIFPVIFEIEENEKGGRIIVSHREGQFRRHDEVKVATDRTSQFLSSIMMVATTLKNGLYIHHSKIVSDSYIGLTSKIMQQFGFDASDDPAGKMHIHPADIYDFRNADKRKYIVDGDWSAAAFFYEIALLNPLKKILLKGLQFSKRLMQGDHRVYRYYEKLGVTSTWFKNRELLISNSGNLPDLFKQSMMQSPDLVPSMAVALSLSGINFHLSMINHLAYKESNRIEAIQKGLAARGYKVKVSDKYDDLFGIVCDKNLSSSPQPIEIDSYGDHRIAMAFAALPLVTGPVIINNAECVSKSYPDFWTHIAKAAPLDLKFF